MDIMDKCKSLIILCLIMSPLLLNAQKVEFMVNNDTFSYSKLNNPIKSIGLIVLFDYGGGNGLSDIPKVSEMDSVLVIDIKIGDWYLQQKNQISKIDNCIKHALYSNGIFKWNFILGGFSGGGVSATRYVELTIEGKKEELIPKGLFIGDAPIDYIEFYKYCEREIVRDCQAPNAGVGKQEAESIKRDYNNSFGDPVVNRDKYVKNSPVTITEPDFGNAKYLLNIAVRTYHEVDPMWHIKERCRNQFTDGNIYVGTALINYLYNNGNHKADVIITYNKGYRSDGVRHPHSWSIIEAKGLLEWYKGLVK